MASPMARLEAALAREGRAVLPLVAAAAVERLGGACRPSSRRLARVALRQAHAAATALLCRDERKRGRKTNTT